MELLEEGNWLSFIILYGIIIVKSKMQDLLRA